MRLLRDLTAGRFRDGAVARVVAMEFWTRGEAPTFEEFARSWTKAKAEEHRLLTPEYAYLTDLSHQRADGDWKALRKAKAKSALETLARIAPVRAAKDRIAESGTPRLICRSSDGADYFSFAYSACACARTGTSGSASFHNDQEVLVRGSCAHLITRARQRSGFLQESASAGRVSHHQSPMVEDLLKLRDRLLMLSVGGIGLSTDVHGIQASKKKLNAVAGTARS